MLNSWREKKFAVIPERHAGVAEHLKARSAVPHQGGFPTWITRKLHLHDRHLSCPYKKLVRVPDTQQAVGEMLPGKFKTNPTQES